MKRIPLSLLAGFLTAAVLSSAVAFALHAAGIFPPIGQPFYDTGLVALAFGYRAIFSILGTFVTAVVAKDRAKAAVMTLGILGSLVWLIGGIVMWEYGPAWYNLGGAVTGVPFALIGGRLHALRVARPKAQIILH